MPFCKVQKNKAYFKRFQVKYRRRRSGKTDYGARRKLITQDKNKYNMAKYRLVVRFSNKYVTAQIVRAHIKGDEVMYAANSRELIKHGLSVGLKNYAACYATGLLVARRALAGLVGKDGESLDDKYPGVEDVTGEPISMVDEDTGRTFYVEELHDSGARPFRCLLDVGIKATTTGSRVFAVMKGASDGGLDIPHNERRFPGYDRDTKEFDAETHRARIFGEHVADYMREMEEDDEEMYQKHFKTFIDNEIEADDLEDLYEKVHASIREDPSREAKKAYTPDRSFMHPARITYEERKARAAAKKEQLRADE